ncbi:MAG: pyridoxal phosphate-dependent aminotransferase [Sphaerochaetaceae bacterium]|nr:pyridoxal phosphate-dependent aminotransferase [Sphaerochaetaceae bacterium]
MNKLLSGISASATVSFNNLASRLKSEGKSIVSLAGGDPDFDTPEKIKASLVRALNCGHTHYCDVRGLKALREKLSFKLREENNIMCSEKNIIVTPGAKYAVCLAIMAVAGEGDEVLIPQPSWVSYEAMTRLGGALPVGFPLSVENGYEITRSLLEENCTDRTKAIVINSPNNPTGHVLSSDEWQTVRDFVRDHELYLISDEVYESIIFDGRKNISPASFLDISPRVITVNSFSKAYAMTGWRMGYLCASEEITDVIATVLSHEISCVNEFVQYAGITALECREESLMMAREYERRRDYLVKELSSLEGFEAVVPQGAFYLWVRIEKNGMNSEELAMWLLEKAGVVTVPGSSFGKGGEKFLRFCFAYSMKDLEEAVRRIKKCI